MPFFMKTAVQYFKNKSSKHVTLQVRILCRSFFQVPHRHRKRAFPSASGSMTLEAALVLSLFIFCAVSLILPMKVMMTDRKIQAALEAVSEDFSRYAYLQNALERGSLLSVPGAGAAERQFCKNLGAGAAVIYAHSQVMKHVDTKNVTGAGMMRTEMLQDGETIDLVLDYEIRMPFPVLGLSGIKRTARSRRRAWIGRAGGDGADGQAGDEHDGKVYVGRDSTRYHKDRNCHYLSNSLTAVSFEEVGDRRNQGGGRYHACSTCGPGQAGGTVFIMPYGSSYHTERSCGSIIAYVQSVDLSQVEHLGPCSYCSK